MKKRANAALAVFKTRHDVSTYFAPKWSLPDPWSAFFNRDPRGRSVLRLIHEFSFASCVALGLIAHGPDEACACKALAKRNGLAFAASPSDPHQAELEI